MPENTQAPKNVLTGKVLAAGSGSLAFDGSPIPMESGIVEGAIVLFKKYEAEKVPDEDGLLLVDQRQILAVL